MEDLRRSSAPGLTASSSTPIATMSLEDARRSILNQIAHLHRFFHALEGSAVLRWPESAVERHYLEWRVMTRNIELTQDRIDELEALAD